jgi:hypothetical protein
VLLRLLSFRQLKSGGYGLDGGAYPRPLHDGRGNSCPGIGSLGWVTVKRCGVAVTMPQGQSRVPDPLNGQQ